MVLWITKAEGNPGVVKDSALALFDVLVCSIHQVKMRVMSSVSSYAIYDIPHKRILFPSFEWSFMQILYHTLFRQIYD